LCLHSRIKSHWRCYGFYTQIYEEEEEEEEEEVEVEEENTKVKEGRLRFNIS